jgi:hypothetical protein
MFQSAAAVSDEISIGLIALISAHTFEKSAIFGSPKKKIPATRTKEAAMRTIRPIVGRCMRGPWASTDVGIWCLRITGNRQEI